MLQQVNPFIPRIEDSMCDIKEKQQENTWLVTQARLDAIRQQCTDPETGHVQGEQSAIVLFELNTLEERLRLNGGKPFELSLTK